MSNIFSLLVFYYCCICLTCHAAIWKTEDAYIIDDLPEDDTHVVTADNSNACVDSSGAQGQCVSREECNGHYKFYTDEEKESKLDTLIGIQRYMNGTDSELCTPANTNFTTAAPVDFVCCTSLKYANVPNITLDEYNAKYSEETPIEPPPEIPLATANFPDLKIVAGQVARVGEFPFAVAIIFRGQQICGGSLIDSQWVLSAAHCFDKFNSQAVRQLVIKVGDHDISSTGEAAHQDRIVAKLMLHPGFFRTRGYFKDDVALIKLKTPVSPGGNIRTIALHRGSPDINAHVVEAIVCGWGKTCNGCGQSSLLRKTKLNLVGNSQCSQRYAGAQAPPITQNMVCAGGIGGMDSCSGDSGGPLIIYSGGQPVQIGVVSWGIGCGQYPGVYTRVQSFVNWIEKHKLKP